jgi:hypothetical protein
MTETLSPAAGRNSAPPAATTTNSQVPRPSKAAWWAGWVISAIPILWMGVLGPVFALTNRALVEEGMTKYGYPASSVMPLQIVAFVCVVLYAIPQTAVLGAILLTGYLGGAVATHVSASEPWFFPIIVGVLVWLGLFLRDPRLRALVPFRKM